MSNELLHWDPFDDVRAMRRLMERAFPTAPATAREGEASSIGELALPVDIFEKNDQVVIKAAVPGVKPADVVVTVSENVLTIAAETKAEADVKEGDWHRREHRYGRWSRSFRLPPDLDSERSTAEFEHGVLRLTIPRKAEARPRTFTVQVQHRG